VARPPGGRLLKPSIAFAALVCAPFHLANAATYPVSARLTVAPLERQHCVQTPGGGRKDCSVIEQARIAYQAVISTMFEQRSPPDLNLVLTVEDAEIFEQVNGGLSFDMVVRISIQTPAGEELDRIESDGRIGVSTGSAVYVAAAEAAKGAARDFEVRYARSEAVSRYLVAHNIAKAAAVSIAPRSDRLVWLAAGLGPVQGSGDDDLTWALSVRLGASFGWIMAQAMYSRYTSSFEAVIKSPVLFAADRFPTQLTVDDFGLEAGAVLRLTSNIEVHAGPGIHYLRGSPDVGSSATTPQSPPSVNAASKLAPTVFASIRGSFLPFRNGFRFFAGLEARAYFSTAVDFPELSRRVPLANTSFAVFAGGELPWSSHAQ
jgi:hypothetical protein